MPLHPRWRRALVIVALCLALALVASSAALHGTLLRLLGAVEGIMQSEPALAATLYTLLAAASAMLAFFSSSVLVPAAVHAWGMPTTAALLWLGWVLGGALAYLVGRALGRTVVQSLASKEVLAQYEDRFTERTPWGLVLLFQLALPSEVPGYLLGIVRYPMLRFLAAAAIAEVPVAVLVVYLGDSFMARRTLALVAAGALAAALSVGAYVVLHRRLERGGVVSR